MLYIIVNSLQNDLISYYHSFNFFCCPVFCGVRRSQLRFSFHCNFHWMMIILMFSFSICKGYDISITMAFRVLSKPMIEVCRFFSRLFGWCFFFVFNHFACACVFWVFFCLSFSSIKRRVQAAQQLKRFFFVHSFANFVVRSIYYYFMFISAFFLPVDH